MADEIHEYAFDVRLVASIRVKARTEDEARRLLKFHIDCADANLGMWPYDEPILCEVSIDDLDEDAVYEIDGEEV